MSTKWAKIKIKHESRGRGRADQIYRERVAFWLIILVWVICFTLVSLDPKPPVENFWRNQFNEPVEKQLPLPIKAGDVIAKSREEPAET